MVEPLRTLQSLFSLEMTTRYMTVIVQLLANKFIVLYNNMNFVVEGQRQDCYISHSQKLKAATVI